MKKIMRKQGEQFMNENVESVINSIKNKYDELFSAEKKVADYILENPGKTIVMNISELAKKSETSEATVVRMCKHVGYQGYYQMRIILSHDLGKNKDTYNDNEKLNSSKKIFNFCAKRVTSLSNSIDMETLLNAAKLIKSSRMVYLVAAGNTSPIAVDLGFRLERCGIPCSYSMIAEHFLNHVNLGTSDDTVIAISRSGASKQVVQAMALAKKNNLHSIVISGERDTQLSENSDCVFHIVEKNEDIFGKTVPDSHLCELAINDAILYAVKYYDALTKEDYKEDENYTEDEIELLLSEYKL